MGHVDTREVTRRVTQLRAEGSESSLQAAAEIEREAEKSTLENLREQSADTPEREALEKAYPRRSGGSSSSRKRSGGGSSSSRRSRGK